MGATGLFGCISILWWALLALSISVDRSRYRNCYLLFLAVNSLFPFVITLAGDHGGAAAILIMNIVLVLILIVPFFLIFNGIVMMKKEGRKPAHMLSFFFGLVILAGEALCAWALVAYALYYDDADPMAFFGSGSFIAGALFTISVIYVSMSFLIFMVYTVFLQVIPRQNDFDYVIIHGAGLLEGERLTKLLQDRVDKAIEVYRKDPTPPKLIPSGGQGSDEKISEAEAMTRYLIEQGIPEEDIIMEDRSATTMDNLKNSKAILDGLEGRKYTALVTSNYHVYRALRYCRKIGLTCLGIGSRVAFYYWPSALIREYIAIHTEKKRAIIFVIGWLVCISPVFLLML